MPHDVFVSYSSDDKPTADAVCATLEMRGIRCWIAPRDVLPGVDWGAAIIEAINASGVMVLVYSAKANDSPQIKREVERAVNRGLTIIPFRIQDVPMSKTLEYFMSMPHWLDALTPPLQEHLDRLADTTRLILGRAGATPPATDEGVPPAQEPTPLTTSGDIARGIGRWVTGGMESATLAEVFVPRTDKVAKVSLVVAGVIAIALLAQIRLGPIWLQPFAILLTAAVLGSRGGGLAASIYVLLGILGMPVFAPGVSAWTVVDYRAPYVRYGLGYLVGVVAAAFAVGYLTERRSWDRRVGTAARLGVVGAALLFVPGFIWLELATLLMREQRAPAGVLPSIFMLIVTVAALAFGLPRAWSLVASRHQSRGALASGAASEETRRSEHAGHPEARL
jgi:biotin transporter BioY